MSKELILFLSFAVGDLTEKADALGLVFGEEVVLYSQLEIQRSNVHLKAGFMSIRQRWAKEYEFFAPLQPGKYVNDAVMVWLICEEGSDEI